MLNYGMRGASPYPEASLIGGEAIDPTTWGRLREEDQIRFFNVYGPTECTVDVSVCRISETIQPSIGQPINNVAAYVLSNSLQPLPPGEVGELYVAGVGLARGYCKRPDLTAERFIPDPISDVAGSRLYRTGDLARLLPDGKLEFCGRRDEQVKIRGYRVELEEIASVLRNIQGVRDAVVLMTETNTGPSRLLAYLVPEPETVLNPERLRNELRRELPEYMTPAGFVILDALPITVNGKVDRKALLLRSDGQRTASAAYAPARDRMEEIVVAIWEEVLGLRQAGIHDNFFDLGGHSLAMVQVRSKLREVLNKEVPMVDLFRNPTIALLSQYLREGQTRNPSLQPAQSRARKRIKAANRISH
jgi:acyl carrier protein